MESSMEFLETYKIYKPKREFVVSVYIFDNQKVLLHKHTKLGKWLPPGGHLESSETPQETAHREVLEETGLTIEILTQEKVWIEACNATSLITPYLCMLENIPPYQDIEAHQHIDLIYIARPLSTKIFSKEDLHFYWFSKEDILQLNEEIDLFVETKKILLHLFSELTIEPINHDRS